MIDICRSTEAYEKWLAAQIAVLPADLKQKHQAMAEGPFPFLRATFYRWVQQWPVLCPAEAAAPTVLAVGDLHVENFGTSRDTEARLIWGINDFDEAYEMPYTIDLVRWPPVHCWQRRSVNCRSRPQTPATPFSTATVKRSTKAVLPSCWRSITIGCTPWPWSDWPPGEVLEQARRSAHAERNRAGRRLVAIAAGCRKRDCRNGWCTGLPDWEAWGGSATWAGLLAGRADRPGGQAAGSLGLRLGEVAPGQRNSLRKDSRSGSACAILTCTWRAGGSCGVWPPTAAVSS